MPKYRVDTDAGVYEVELDREPRDQAELEAALRGYKPTSPVAAPGGSRINDRPTPATPLAAPIKTTPGDPSVRLSERMQREVAGLVTPPPKVYPPEPAGARPPRLGPGSFLTSRPYGPMPEMDAETWKRASEIDQQNVKDLAELEALGTDISGVSEKKEPPRPGLMMRILDLALRPNYAIAGAAMAAFKDPSTPGSEFAGAWRGLTGQEQYNFGDVLKEAGLPELGSIQVNPYYDDPDRARRDPRMHMSYGEPTTLATGRGVLGFAMDVGLDPLTYTTVGASRSAIELGAKMTLRPDRILLPRVWLNDAGKAELVRQIARAKANGAQGLTARAIAEANLQVRIRAGQGGDLIDANAVRFAGKAIPGSKQAIAAIERGWEKSLHKLEQALGYTKKGESRLTTLRQIFQRDAAVAHYLPYIEDKNGFINSYHGVKANILDEEADLARMATGPLDDVARERITYAVERSQRGGIDQLALDRPDLAAIARYIDASQKNMRQMEISAGLATTMRSEYMRHLWKNPRVEPLTGLGSGMTSPGMRENLQRTYDTIEEGMKAGLEPITKDAFQLFAQRRLAHERVFLAREFLESTVQKYGFTKTEGHVWNSAVADLARGNPLSTLQQAAIAKGHKIGLGARWMDEDLVTIGKIRGLEQFKDLMIPRAIARDINSSLGMYTEPGVQGGLQILLTGYDQMLNMTKRALTIFWPSFHARNYTTNVVNSALDIGLVALNGPRRVEAWQILLGKQGEFVTQLGERYTFDHLRELATSHGVLGEFRGKLEIMSSTKREIERVTSSNPLTQFSRGAEHFGSKVEDEARMFLWLTYLRRGYGPDEAARRVNKFLFDYDMLSPVERGLLRRAIPFYTFMRHNLPLQAKAVIARPGYQAFLGKVFAARGDVPPEDLQYLPEYVNSGLALPLGRTPNGEPLYFVGLGLPMEDLNRILPGAHGEKSYRAALVNNWMWSAAPMIRGALSLAFQWNIQMGEPLDPRSKISEAYGDWVDKMPTLLQEMVGFKKTYDRRGRPIYVMNTAAVVGLQSFFLSRVYTQSGKFLQPGTPWGAAAMKGFTGWEIAPQDISGTRVTREAKTAIERQEQIRRLKGEQKRELLFGGETK